LRLRNNFFAIKLQNLNAIKSQNQNVIDTQRTFENKLKMDDAEKLRRKIYQAKQMRVIRNPDIAFYKENFESWKADVTRWKTDIKNGQRSSEEFIQWLNESNKRQ
jgi:hypothetical protein